MSGEVAHFCDEVPGDFSCCGSCHEHYVELGMSMIERERDDGSLWIICCAAGRALDAPSEVPHD